MLNRDVSATSPSTWWSPTIRCLMISTTDTNFEIAFPIAFNSTTRNFFSCQVLNLTQHDIPMSERTSNKLYTYDIELRTLPLCVIRTSFSSISTSLFFSFIIFWYLSMTPFRLWSKILRSLRTVSFFFLYDQTRRRKRRRRRQQRGHQEINSWTEGNCGSSNAELQWHVTRSRTGCKKYD